MYPRPRWTNLGSNSLLCCERSIADHLSHGMAQLIMTVRKNRAPSSILHEAKIAYYVRNMFEAARLVFS